MEKNRERKLVPFYTNPEKDNNYMLFIEPKTNYLFRADTKNVTPITFFLIIIGYPIVEYFPIHIIPFDNITSYLGIVVVVSILSVLFGYYISPYMMENCRRFYLTLEEWEEYLNIIHKFYFRRLLFPLICLLVSIICFICFYTYPTSWLFCFGIISSIVAGAGVTSFSKTHYLAYKKELNINLEEGGTEDEDIIYW